MADLRDPIIRRIQDQARASNLNPMEAADLAAFERAPRWRLTTKDIEFECGCVARRFRSLRGVKDFDPIIFKGLPEQAVYDSVCRAHEPGMHKYLKFGGYTDFKQWRAARLRLITGEVL